MMGKLCLFVGFLWLNASHMIVAATPKANENEHAVMRPFQTPQPAGHAKSNLIADEFIKKRALSDSDDTASPLAGPAPQTPPDGGGPNNTTSGCIDVGFGCIDASERSSSFSWDDIDRQSADEEGDGNPSRLAKRPKDLELFLIGLFIFAAMWLLIAIIYSLLLLLVLHMQAHGQLDIYDDDFGTFRFCGGRLRIRMGCILRRYAIQLDLNDQQRRQPHQEGQPSTIRIMTRHERRNAIDALLQACVSESAEEPSIEKPRSPAKSTSRESAHSDASAGHASVASECTCAICLSGYETGDKVYKSSTCSHHFHHECILDWLQRRANSQCPCCRKDLVDEEEVWQHVKQTRKKLRKQSQGEAVGLKAKLARWFLGRSDDQSLVSESVEGENTDSSDHDESDLEIGNSSGR